VKRSPALAGEIRSQNSGYDLGIVLVGVLSVLVVWPKAPHIMSGRLKRFAGFLRARGIEIEWGKSGTRQIKILKKRE
jgi:hypothetical protein